MKNQLVKLAVLMSFLSASAAFAQTENQKDDFEAKKTEMFKSHKAEILKSLNEEKSVIEKEISCVNSAQKGDDARKCHEAKKASMDKIREQREKNRENRKEEFQQKREEFKEKREERSQNRSGTSDQ